MPLYLSLFYGSDKTCYFFWWEVPARAQFIHLSICPHWVSDLGVPWLWEESQYLSASAFPSTGGKSNQLQGHSIHPGNKSDLEPCLAVLAPKKAKWFADVGPLCKQVAVSSQ